MIDHFHLASPSTEPLIKGSELSGEFRPSSSESTDNIKQMFSHNGVASNEDVQNSPILVPSASVFDGMLRHVLSLAVDEPFAVLRFGLDHFKALKDLFGRSISDGVLKRGSERLQSALREHDRLLQLPGDEFVVLLRSHADPVRAQFATERLQELLQKPYLVQGQLVTVKASVGVLAGPDRGADPEVLLRRAGVALECARATGPGTVCRFELAMEERLLKRHALLLDLRKALPLRQFAVHYQPQVDIRSGRLTGFEALLRWNHPKLGPISPGEFIPLAEEYSMIAGIGDWVLRTACHQARKLPDEVLIAVNASPLQFETGSFPETVRKALMASDLPAERLEIEITEGVLIRNNEKIRSVLEELSTMGVRLAMDDFGTGYSCLGQLADLPFNVIKIDRSLVGGTPKQRAIVRAISALSEGIGMSVLAEGIETEEQLAKALSDGCCLAQGYLFGKALPASDLDEVIKRLHGPD